MSDLIDKHELRIALEGEERSAKNIFRRQDKEAYVALITMFFEIVYRTLNKTKGMPVLCDGAWCPECEMFWTGSDPNNEDECGHGTGVYVHAYIIKEEAWS